MAAQSQAPPAFIGTIGAGAGDMPAGYAGGGYNAAAGAPAGGGASDGRQMDGHRGSDGLLATNESSIASDAATQNQREMQKQQSTASARPYDAAAGYGSQQYGAQQPQAAYAQQVGSSHHGGQQQQAAQGQSAEEQQRAYQDYVQRYYAWQQQQQQYQQHLAAQQQQQQQQQQPQASQHQGQAASAAGTGAAETGDKKSKKGFKAKLKKAFGVCCLLLVCQGSPDKCCILFSIQVWITCEPASAYGRLAANLNHQVRCPVARSHTMLGSSLQVSLLANSTLRGALFVRHVLHSPQPLHRFTIHRACEARS